MSNFKSISVKTRELSYKKQFKALRVRSNMLRRAATEVGLKEVHECI